MDRVDLLSVFIIALGLSADCFAVALSSSIAQKSGLRAALWRLPFLFGVFQSLMTVTGWGVGRSVVEFISDYDHWVAFGLLAVIGARMIWQSLRASEKEKTRNFTSWFILVTLSVATSIDALAVGLSFAFLKVDIVVAVVTIGLTAFVITLLGALIGRRVGVLVGERAETIGGLILIIIGLRILLEHLF